MFNKVLAFIGTFQTLVVAIAVLAGSTSLNLVTSVLVADNEEKPVPLASRAPAAAFHVVVNAFRFYTFWLKCSSVVYLAFGMFSKLEHMTPPGVSSNFGKRSNVKTFQKALRFAREYRTLAVFQTHFASIYRDYTVQTLIGGSTAVAFNAYQAVVRGSVRGLFLTLAETFGLVQFIQSSARVC